MTRIFPALIIFLLPLSATADEAAAVGFLPGFASLLPPLAAIALAFLLRQVLIALFAGIWLGAFLLNGFRPLSAIFTSMDRYLVNAVADTGHASILIFTLTIGGMVAILYRNGGIHGVADALARRVRSARGAQVTTGLLGLAVFFDDYANTLIVGNTMRSLTDRMRISREKLAFLVDSTSAPVAGLALISTWIGTEVGLIGDALSRLPVQGDGYSYFLASLPFRFYPLFMLVLVFSIAASGRDFFSMAKAERRARSTGRLHRDNAQIPNELSDEASVPQGVPRRAVNAVIPILTVVIGTIVGLWTTGSANLENTSLEGFERIRAVVGAADSYKALLWSSVAGTVIAIALTVGQRILSLGRCMDAFVSGIKAMVMACLILCLAWGLGAVTMDAGTNQYLSTLLTGRISPFFLPMLVFVTAALVSFATGTSWGTMSILMPIAVPLAYTLGDAAGFTAEASHRILLGSISSVLAGAIFGDHCSPISDTTVMSSLASGCDHLDHVRTQMPYAVLIAVLGMVLGDLPTAFGLSPWISLAGGTLTIILLVRLLGRPS